MAHLLTHLGLSSHAGLPSETPPLPRPTSHLLIGLTTPMGPTAAPPLVEPTAPARVSLLGFLGQRAVYLPCQHLPASPLSLGSRSALASLWGPGRGTRSQALHLDRTQAQGASLDSELLRVSATPSLRPPSSELGVCSQHGLNPQGRKLPAKGQVVNIWGLCFLK